MNTYIFRDDIVFFIFLYQRYIYKEDKSRVNEYGFSGDMLEEMEQKKGGEAVTQENEGEGEEQLAVTDNSQEEAPGTSAAWKNSQKQKTKKSKKND